MARLNTFIHKYFYESCRFYDPVYFFVRGLWGDGAVLIISKNLPLKGKFFEMVSWGGLGGRSPPQESPLPVPCPPGGLGGFAPSGISVNYPCLASAAAVPCPRALPPIFFRPNFFRPNFFRRNFFRRNFFVGIFSSEFFRLNFFRPSSVRRPSVVRPSVRPTDVRRTAMFINLCVH